MKPISREIIAKYATIRAGLPPVPARKRFASDAPERRRERYLKLKATKPQTPHRTRYGRIGVKTLFPAIASRLGISEAAARGRYYRTVESQRKQLLTEFDSKSE